MAENFNKENASAIPSIHNQAPSAEQVAMDQKRVVAELLAARDAAVARLADAYVSVREKVEVIRRLEAEREELKSTTATNNLVSEKDGARVEETLESTTGQTSSQNDIDHTGTQPLIHPARPAAESQDPQTLALARHALLASLPLPEDIPEDALKPFVIPPPCTLHEFLGGATGTLRNSLANYRVFQHLTTAWCPAREEHGYMLAPVFKCSTNPRVATAHRWNAVDVVARMGKATECFYNKEGKWYYAGIYKAFRMDDLTVKEWEALSAETAQSIIKETLSSRKNTSPQNVYETSQLYAAGALKVACIGLQCVGFNTGMYRALLDMAARCAISGKWGAGNGTSAKFGGSANTSPVIATPTGVLASGAAWNAASGAQGIASTELSTNSGSNIVDGMASMGLGIKTDNGAAERR